MEKITLEKQGRILIPKKMRERLHLHTGEELFSTAIKEKIVLNATISNTEFSSYLQGCVKQSDSDPLTLKKMWQRHYNYEIYHLAL